MMPSCYLTIDDSPSPHTDAMIDFLAERHIPAVLFCRGDLLEANPAPVIRAIQKGFVIGNHSYAHKPFGDFSFEEAVADIERADQLIDAAYQKADIQRPGMFFRFPYLDRGNGDRIERHFETVTDIDINADPKVADLQSYLRGKGYRQPFSGVTHPVYANGSIAAAADCLMTYTSFDWMLTPRHKGKWDYKDIESLKKRIDDDVRLRGSNGNILIFHDQPDLLPIFQTLIDHMLLNGYDFLRFQ